MIVYFIHKVCHNIIQEWKKKMYDHVITLQRVRRLNCNGPLRFRHTSRICQANFGQSHMTFQSRGCRSNREGAHNSIRVTESMDNLGIPNHLVTMGSHFVGPPTVSSLSQPQDQAWGHMQYPLHNVVPRENTREDYGSRLCRRYGRYYITRSLFL